MEAWDIIINLMMEHRYNLIDSKIPAPWVTLNNDSKKVFVHGWHNSIEVQQIRDTIFQIRTSASFDGFTKWNEFDLCKPGSLENLNKFIVNAHKKRMLF